MKMTLFIVSNLTLLAVCNTTYSQEKISHNDRPIGVRLATIPEIESYVNDPGNGVATVEQFMKKVDPILLGNYVLMEKSNSRQQPSTVEYPRIILFRPDGRLMLGIATNRCSEAYHDVEMLEFTKDNEWSARAVTLDPKTFNRPIFHEAGPRSGDSCSACHGPHKRPIWGNYNQWIGAYAKDASLSLSREQAEVLSNLTNADNPNPNPRLKMLTFDKELWQEGNTFTLPDQARGYSPEAFGDAIEGRHVESIWTRAKRVQRSDLFLLAFPFRQTYGLRLRQDLRNSLLDRINREWVDRDMSLRYSRATDADKGFLLLGLDGVDNMFMASRTKDFTDEQRREQIHVSQWMGHSMTLGNLITLRLLNDLAERNPAIKQAFVESAPPPGTTFDNLDEFRREVTTFYWGMTLQETTEYLRTKIPPTGDLRPEHIFSAEFQQKAQSALEEHVEAVLRNYP